MNRAPARHDRKRTANVRHLPVTLNRPFVIPSAKKVTAAWTPRSYPGPGGPPLPLLLSTVFVAAALLLPAASAVQAGPSEAPAFAAAARADEPRRAFSALSWLLPGFPGGAPVTPAGDGAPDEAATASEAADDTAQGPSPDKGHRYDPLPRPRPLELYRNNTVESVIAFLLREKRDVVARGLVRSGRYLPMIRRIFAEQGLPAELAYLAAVESNFNPRARSPARAVGMWQIMAPTARKFGLRLERPWYDERLDPERATRAAGRFLAYLYDRYGAWELALAAYNAGEGRVNRALRRARRQGRPADYWSLRLPRQTRGFVPAFLAVAAIYEQPRDYGLGLVQPEAPLDAETLELTIATTLDEIARRTGAPADLLQRLNPAWKRGVIPPQRTGPVVLNVPAGTGRRLLASLEREPPEPIPWLVHDVREGETVSHIARRYGVRTGDVLALNGLHARSLLRIGQPLLVPLAEGDPVAARQARRPEGPPPGALPQTARLHYHRVADGESLWTISRHYNVRMSDLRAWNGLDDSLIHPGRELVVYAPAGEGTGPGMDRHGRAVLKARPRPGAERGWRRPAGCLFEEALERVGLLVGEPGEAEPDVLHGPQAADALGPDDAGLDGHQHRAALGPVQVHAHGRAGLQVQVLQELDAHAVARDVAGGTAALLLAPPEVDGGLLAHAHPVAPAVEALAPAPELLGADVVPVHLGVEEVVVGQLGLEHAGILEPAHGAAAVGQVAPCGGDLRPGVVALLDALLFLLAAAGGFRHDNPLRGRVVQAVRVRRRAPRRRMGRGVPACRRPPSYSRSKGKRKAEEKCSIPAIPCGPQAPLGQSERGGRPCP